MPKSIRDRRSPKSISFNVLSQFVYSLVNFSIQFELARDIILHFCEKYARSRLPYRYDLGEENTHLLLSELESA